MCVYVSLDSALIASSWQHTTHTHTHILEHMLGYLSLVAQGPGDSYSHTAAKEVSCLRLPLCILFGVLAAGFPSHLCYKAKIAYVQKN